jgi:hypothetical protein
MGYAHYGTPMGPAGYGITDVCYQKGCSETINRGLAYLCGSTPGYADEYGCGHWFCDQHLYIPPAEVSTLGGGLCNACLLRFDGVGDDDDEGTKVNE